ncbi:RNA polymerase sigma-54 factor [Bacteroidia bacterium]|nr:RNA polymerase sigma-54 factor [Bacteroidia bacterium]
MQIRQNLQQKLGLKVNPIQIQFVKLLEIPTSQLEQRIKEELEENPLLEEGVEEKNELEYDDLEESDLGEVDGVDLDGMSDSDDERKKEEDKEGTAEEGDIEIDATEIEPSGVVEPESPNDYTLEDYIDEGEIDNDIPNYKLSVNNGLPDETKDFIISQKQTFRESIRNQLGAHSLDNIQQKVVEYIIGNIDEDGYLRRDIENIVDDISFGAGLDMTKAEVEGLLQLIQACDPAGIGAGNLQECLLLQIVRKLAATPSKQAATRGTTTYYLKKAELILRNCFIDFSKKHYDKIAKRLQMSDDEMKKTIAEILKLNPRPGNTEADSGFENAVYKIIPDFTLDLVDGELQLHLNSENIPPLRINKSYLDLLDKNSDKKDVVSFVKYKYNSAKFFIDAIQQRNTTLMLTMTAILHLQKNFFQSGDKSQLNPMILKDVADLTGLDVSTLSRVSNSKYIQTWFGVFALKDFFSGSMQNTSGEDISKHEVKDVLRSIVDAENKTCPYTDDDLVTMMEQKGYKLARRTVAKYRQMLDIPVARMRVEM